MGRATRLGLALTCVFCAWLAGASQSLSGVSQPKPRSSAASQGDEPRVEASLLVHPEDADAPAARVGVLLEIAPGWHVSAADPGDVGLPLRVHWSAEGGEVEAAAWPEPHTYTQLDGELVSYGYEGSVLLPARVRFAELAGSRSLRAELELVACAEECIPDSLTLERDLAQPPSARDAAAAAVVFGRGGPASPAPSRGSAAAILRAAALAFLGGLILNLMPCVLPVLAIKALSLAELGRRGPRQAAPHAAAYAAGVLGSMLVLAGLILALRAAGTAVGWGFQFREPIFVAAVASILVIFAANLFGAFEIGADTARLAGLGNQATGWRRSFFDGLLTVVLATPCSAPFLGTAVGFALGSGAAVVVTVFVAIGAGLAAPLVLAALLPASARRIPRAGPWMLELRAALGFVLLGAVLWLLWILGRSLGADAVVAVASLLLAVGFGSWLYGRLQRRGRAPRPAVAALAAAALLGLAGGTLRTEPAQHATEPEAFRRDLVAERLREGRPVFVYFTADWCITCKVNERLVLADERVRETLDQLGFSVLRADWTRRDETLRMELARFGRSGVPAYLLFSPGEPESPRLLPEILTVGAFVEALHEVEASAKVTPITRRPSGGSMGGSVTHPRPSRRTS